MLTRDDLVDIILESLASGSQVLGGSSSSFLGGGLASRSQAPHGLPPAPPSGARPHPTGAARLFLSEYDVKRRLTPHSQQLKIPKDAILSPLALDWLVLRGICIVKE
ncbi:MAG: hypothetical protein HY924_12300 [Elusimicrobia bacterium]|nr:hypothetical protein [Elusimicrobiota bacterium]